MIIVKNRELLIPNNERYIGTTYDDNSTVRTFRISRFHEDGMDKSQLDFYVIINYDDGSDPDAVGVVKAVNDDYIVLEWDVGEDVTDHPGCLYLWVRGFDHTGTVRWSSFPGVFYIEGSGTAPTDLSELEQRISEEDKLIRLAKLYKSQPMVAPTAADMKDRESIYVYVGNEVGYQYGHWYFWNSSAWTPGGVYNSIAIQTDKGLIASDVAADAKVVGDKIADLWNTKPYVVPEMYGAVGDGVTDDYQAFVSALNSGKQVLLSAKAYRLSSPVLMPSETCICGSDRYKSVLHFDTGVNGVRINWKTVLKNCTIYIEGNAKAVFAETKSNSNYNLGTYVGNIDIVNSASTATGTGIELIAEASTTGQNGMYNILFDDVVMRGAFKYGIKLTNRVKTPSENETWITGVTFRDVFIQAAETAIESSWTDISGSNTVPITGQASKNRDVKFIRVDAQYTNGITKCYARIYNAINAVFDHCTTFDYWHLRYDLHLPFYELNATSGMCTVEINGNSEIVGTTLYDISQYIGCINGNISTAFHDIIKSIYTSATRTSEKEFIDPYTEESTDIIPATGMSPTVSLYKRGGVVQLMINVLIDTQAEAPHNYVSICTLPSGYRPKYNILKSTFSNNYPYIFIGIDGIVKIWVNIQNLEKFYISESFVAAEV